MLKKYTFATPALRWHPKVELLSLAHWFCCIFSPSRIETIPCTQRDLDLDVELITLKSAIETIPCTQRDLDARTNWIILRLLHWNDTLYSKGFRHSMHEHRARVTYWNDTLYSKGFRHTTTGPILRSIDWNDTLYSKGFRPGNLSCIGVVND